MDLKKVLSGMAAAVAAGVLVEVGRTVVPTLSPLVQVAAVSAIAYVAHVLDTWGHTDRVEKAIEAARKEDAAKAAP